MQYLQIYNMCVFLQPLMLKVSPVNCYHGRGHRPENGLSSPISQVPKEHVSTATLYL